MALKFKHFFESPLLKKYLRLRSSIYGSVIYIITVLSIFLFVSFGIIFRSVNEEYMKSLIHQRGANAALLVRSALYHSMLENNRNALQSNLDIINRMSGIDEVNLYDSKENLAYSSFTANMVGHSNPNCLDCHQSIKSVLPEKDNYYKVIEIKSECEMNQNDNNHRHLLINSPILNEKSCYTSSCHAHKQNEKVLGSLVIKIPLEDLDNTLEKSSKDFYLLATLTTILLLIFLIFFTRKRIKKPLNALIKASDAVSKGDRNTRLEINPSQLDDMRMVSVAFNDMLDSLQEANNELQNWSQQLEYKVRMKSEELGQAQNELINVEKIASLGKLSLSVAHEINNPLSGILIYTKLVQKQLLNQEFESGKKESVLKHLKMIETETKRCGDIVKGLLDFSRKDQDFFEDKSLHQLLQDTYDLMSHSMKIAKIGFFIDFSATTDTVYCSPNQIKQACIAVLVNASEAVSENGEIVIRTRNSDKDIITVDFIDNGSGISAEDIPHIFDPFFSSKHNARGTGLGLAIVHGIVQSHEGKISVKSELGKGTTISITFPLKNPEKNE
ncbi:MAG: HAMP domain-containing protein [Bacteroidia bacterium]|nr:HAMP domain-containing protein [Bacteroidia bacterium]